MVERLETDHILARYLADGLNRIEGLSLDPQWVKTNILYFDLTDSVIHPASEIKARLKAQGILLNPSGPRTFRAVIHEGITRPMIDQTIEVVRQVLAG
jgi:threonine aldolase